MLRFRLGPIPIQVHPSHFLVSAVMGMGGETPGSAAWVQSTLTWMGVVFVSVLVHELGHAFSALAFGYRPTVDLIWLGGVTRPNAPGAIPWKRDVLLTLAGPFAGAMLGVACGALRAVAAFPPGVEELLGTFVWANLAWAVMNLMPVPPLDGGHVAAAVGRRFFGARGDIGAWVLGAVTGFALAFVASRFHLMTVAVLFALLGFQAGATALALRKQGTAASEPEDPALAQAQGLLDAGKLEEAHALAAPLATRSDLLERAGAERLLGWIALKRGQGREALDHFSQVQRLRVEPQALAAAFSLIGDETRALPLWELAYRETQSQTVLHEYAGSLLRAGRTDAALALPGVQAGPAYACAERVLFLRGDYAGAAKLGEEGLSRAPSAEGAYDAACAFARAGQPDDALRLLQRAMALGFRDADFAANDPDLVSLHGHPGWMSFLTTLRESAAR